MTVTFDASSSSPEGHEDYITQYEWDIHDPYNPEHIVMTTPLTSHTFEYDGTYIVELNVTDNEGLWSTTSKPITVLPEFDPTANFTWTPERLWINITATFNASSSQVGWSSVKQHFSPIANYIWNFSDGTGNITVATPTINHTYTDTGNYSVILTIIDDADRTDAVSYVVEVEEKQFPPWDVNQDGKVRVDDVLAVAIHFGENEGDENWYPPADVTGDGKVRVDDVLAVAVHFGEDYI